MTATRRRIVVAVVLWLAALSVALGAMVRYEITPGPSTSVVSRWPAESGLTRLPGSLTLVMFVHPRCPCTSASAAELAEALTGTLRRCDVLVVSCVPAAADETWATGRTARALSEIPGARPLTDPRGIEASRFGARTSGHVMLFDEVGTLVFEGGVTGARGHVGENVGRLSVRAILRGEAPAAARTSVYGCELFADEACPLCNSREKP